MLPNGLCELVLFELVVFAVLAWTGGPHPPLVGLVPPPDAIFAFKSCMDRRSADQIIRVSLRFYRIMNHFPSFLVQSHSFHIKITSSLTSEMGGCAFLALIVFQAEAIFLSLNPTSSVSIHHSLLVVGCSINAPPPLSSPPLVL